MYKITYHKSTIKDLKKISLKKKVSIINKIEKLAINPFVQNTNLKKLQNNLHIYRLRVGKFRIIYEIDQKNKKIVVWKIKPRASVYSK